MRFISRSSHEAFSECQRKGYWGYLYKQGLEPTATQWNLVIGLAVHKGLELLMKGATIKDAVLGLVEDFVTKVPLLDEDGVQHLALAEALLRGWHRVRFPRFMAAFEVLTVEKELLTTLASNIGLRSRLDVLVRDRQDGFNFVINWKTSSSIKDWTQQWEDEIQVITEALSAQENLGLPIAGVLFEGFYKGGKYKGAYTSPLIRGYRMRMGDDQPWTYSAEKRANYTTFSVWKDFPGGVAAWVDWLPEEVVENQFITSAPILKNDDMVRDWLKQVVRRETDIEGMLDPSVPEEDRLSYFWQNKGYRCKWCHFRPACRWEMGIDDMLESGALRVREDHHAVKEGENAGVEHGGVAQGTL
jgi:hypothetical protein